VEEPTLGRALRIADEQRDAVAERDSKHERRVIRAAVGFDAGARGQHGDLGALVASRPSAQLGRSADGYPAPRHSLEERAELAGACVPVGEPALPQLSHFDLVERAGQAEVVVRVRVRQDHHVDSGAAPRSELGHEYPSTDVEPAHLPAAVDEHEPSVREIDEQRISLTNIKRRDPQFAARGACVPGKQLCCDERAAAGETDPKALAWDPPEREGREREDHELDGRRRRQSER